MQINLIDISGGDYQIGDDGYAISRPAHTVTLAPFAMQHGTVTNQQFAAFVADGGYRQQQFWTEIGWRWRTSKRDIIPAFWQDDRFNQPGQPVVGIGWYEAIAFTRWLSAQTAIAYRLPSEVEWEAAAQSPGSGAIHHAGDGIPRTLNSTGTGYQSANGLWQMRGNVWEWCRSRWGRNWQQLDYDYPYIISDGREDLSGSYARVMRGGSWFDPLQASDIRQRGRFLPGSRASNIGFRLAHTLSS